MIKNVQSRRNCLTAASTTENKSIRHDPSSNRKELP
jgi:hypothetical protein